MTTLQDKAHDVVEELAQELARLQDETTGLDRLKEQIGRLLDSDDWAISHSPECTFLVSKGRTFFPCDCGLADVLTTLSNWRD